MANYDELQEQIKKLQAQAEEVKKEEINTALADIKAKIKKYDLTAEQLGFPTTSRKTGKNASHKTKAKPMYRKGDMTWSGLGRISQWVKDARAAGEDIEQYRIIKEATA